MPIFPLLLCGMALLTALTNALTMRTVKASSAISIEDSLEILIPMRNEERNVRGCLEAALATENCPNLKISVLDDHSSDQTEPLLREFNQKISLSSGSNLPDGWMGKNFALSQLADQSAADYLIFMDADVRISPLALSASMALVKEQQWDFLSPYPRQIARSFAELLIQPLLQWSWISSVFLRFAERSPRPTTTIANGQLFIVKRSAYLAIDGHENIKSEVLDDLELARELVRNGYRGAVADASQLISCRMYESFNELKEGYTKSLWRAFGSLGGTTLTVLILTATGIIPLIYTVHGSLTAAFGLTFVLLSRLIAAIKTRSNPFIALLHPLATLLLLYLIALSWWKKSRGNLTWRGRALG